MNIYYYILLFFLYSVLGWIVEIISVFIRTKKIVNRGFLIGPYLPIFGIGAVFVTLLLGNSDLSVFSLFLVSALISGVVEYLVSFFMEAVFGARWWDYSTHKFNINGRVCLLNFLLFGLGSLIILKVVNPYFIDILGKISFSTIKLITYILVAIYFIDTIVTIFTLFRIKNKIRSIRQKDVTEKVNDLVKEQLLKDTILIKRIALSHPTLKIILKKLKQKIQ